MAKGTAVEEPTTEHGMLSVPDVLTTTVGQRHVAKISKVTEFLFFINIDRAVFKQQKLLIISVQVKPT